MSGLMNKVKNALQSEKNTPEAAAANKGSNEYGHAEHATGHGPGLATGLEGDRKASQLPGAERGEHISPDNPNTSTTQSGMPESVTEGHVPGSVPVAQGSGISETNPGVLHSTKPGIHGERDSGARTSLATSGDDSRLSGTTYGTHAGKAAEPDSSVAHGSSMSPTNPGVLHSTKAGIHGQRDSGISGPGNDDNSGLATGTAATGAGVGAAGVAEHEKEKHGLFHHEHKDKPVAAATEKEKHGLFHHEHKDKPVTSTEPEKEKHGLFHRGHKDPTTQDTVTGGSAGPQFTGDNTRDNDLVGSGMTVPGSTTSQTGSGLAGTGQPSTNDSSLATGALAGAGAGAGAGALASHEKNKYDTPGDNLTSDTKPNTSTGTGLAGAGSGYEGNNRDRGIVDNDPSTGSGLMGSTSSTGANYGSTDNTTTGSNLMGSGLGSNTTGSGLDSSTGGSGLTGSNPTGSGLDPATAGSGLGDRRSPSMQSDMGSGLGATGGSTAPVVGDSGLGDGSGSIPGLSGNSSGLGGDGTSRGLGDTTTGGSGLGSGAGMTGSGLDDNTTGSTGMTGSGLGGSTGMTGSSGLGDNTTGTDTTLGQKADPYIEGSEQHHRGDGHPEDIVHPGPHVTGTAKALDPHLN